MFSVWNPRASAAVPPTETLPRTYAIGLLGMLVVLSCALALCPTARLLSTARLSTARSGVAVALDAGNLVQFEKRKGEVSIGALRQGQSGPLAVPQLGSCTSSRCAWRLWAARHSQPLPRVLDPTASKAADSTAVDRSGARLTG